MLDLGTLPNGEPYRLPTSAFDYHAQVIGTTGTGKTYFLMRLFQELVQKTDSSVVFIDPGGQAFHFLRRWCYQKSLDRRLVLIDPGETRFVCGFNPIQVDPARTPGQQAGTALENIRRALGNELFANAPMTAQWMFNVLFSLIETGLTLNEAPDLLDFKPSVLRTAIVDRLRDSDVRRDWLWLADLTDNTKTNMQAMRIVTENLGSSYRRIRSYVRNDDLRLMLSTSERALSWHDLLQGRKIILVNLQRLVAEDQKLFGIQLVSELIQETFRRERFGEGVPCYLIVDEFSRFAAGELAPVLTEGRKYLLRLILAHQNLAQLMNVQREDSLLYHAVIGCATAKIVFGGLSPMDADMMGRTLYGHHLDPEKRKLELWSWIQLSRVHAVESRTSGWSSGAGSGGGTGSGYSYADDPFRGSTFSNTMMSSFQAMDAQQELVTRSLMVQPGEPELQLSSVQFENLEEQLYRHVSRMIRKPQQEAVIALGKEMPVEFRVAHIEEPKIGTIQATEIDVDLMRSLPFYSPPSVIEEEIRDRHAALLAAPPPAAGEEVPEGVFMDKPSPPARRSSKPQRRARPGGTTHGD